MDDEILASNGVRVSAKSLADELKSAAPGDRMRLLIARNERVREVEAVLDPNLQPGFRIQPLPHPDALQAQTLEAWLPNVVGKGR